MNDHEYLSLLVKHFKGALNQEEEIQLKDWLAENPARQFEASQYHKLWLASANVATDWQPDTEAAWKKFSKTLQPEPPATTPLPERRTPDFKQASASSNNKWLYLGAFGVLLLLIVAVILSRGRAPRANEKYENNTATVQIVALNDGSRIYLKPNAVLEKLDKGSERAYRLEGIAFFEVTHDPAHPFTVNTTNGDINVLGTSFTVSAFKGELLKVSVLTGAVKLVLSDINKSTTIYPGYNLVYKPKIQALEMAQQKSVEENHGITKELNFDNTPLQEVLATMTKEFAVNFQLVNLAMNSCKFTGSFKIQPGNRAQCEEMITAICTTYGMELVVLDNFNYRLKKGSCQR